MVRTEYQTGLEKTSSSGVVRVRQKSKSNASSAALKGKGPVGGTVKSNHKQSQRKDGEIEPDNDDIDTNVFENPRLTIESNPLQFNEPPKSNSGANDSSILSVAMEFVWLMSTLPADSDPAPVAEHIVEDIANSTASSSHAPAPLRIPLSPRRSSRRRAASTVHSEAPPSKIMSAESAGVPVIIPESGRRSRWKQKVTVSSEYAP
ncbi:hypothetical protein B0H14DRAFT_2559627 [Mycena olivaceomarginata]|nr:hypothetical protein B0H14DRAFT_2559627 [Mycena olivaceomarginata]